MPSALQFETPENVQVRYDPAGLGTRFVAWFVDQMIVFGLILALFVALIAAGVSFDFAREAFAGRSHRGDRAAMYFFGLMILVWGLGSFVYFGCCELLLRGQTVGKRSSKIRVIKSNGFQLDGGSILVRNLFRVVDHMPPMWLFPLISRLGQRAGDMVAGTIVVVDDPTIFSTVRAVLSARTAAEAQFRFDASKLKRLNDTDFIAVERLLERLPSMTVADGDELARVYVAQLCTKLAMDRPPADQEQRLLEDLLAAELRRRDRNLA